MSSECMPPDARVLLVPPPHPAGTSGRYISVLLRLAWLSAQRMHAGPIYIVSGRVAQDLARIPPGSLRFFNNEGATVLHCCSQFLLCPELVS